MTEASKARKRQAPPRMVVRYPTADINVALKSLKFSDRLVLPSDWTCEWISPRRSTQPRVVTSGISCRVGVGGRRWRKRRRAEGRRKEGQWFVYWQGQPSRMAREIQRFGESMMRGLLMGIEPTASALTAAPRSP